MSRSSLGKAHSPRIAHPGTRSKPHAAAISDSPSPVVEKPAFLDRITALLDRLQRHSNAASLIYLALVLAFALPHLLVGLSRGWFYTADEFMIAGESIRFVDLDPRQHFFDLPGTPFMILTAVLWAVLRPIAQWLAPDPWYGGIDPSATGIIDFTYRHLDWLFTLLRFETIFFWACSLVLLYLVSRKLLNYAGACVACLVLRNEPMTIARPISHSALRNAAYPKNRGRVHDIGGVASAWEEWSTSLPGAGFGVDVGSSAQQDVSCSLRREESLPQLLRL